MTNVKNGLVTQLTKLSVTASLLALSLTTSAAGVFVEAFLITQHGVQPSADMVLNGGGSCTPGNSASQECVQINRSVGLGSPPVDTGTVTTIRSTFDAGNVSQVPNFVMNGNARAFASLGQLHASTFVQVQGAGGNHVSIGGRAHAQITDRVTVRSSTLSDGSPVEIKVLINVSGSGGGRLFFGLNSNFSQVDQANDSGISDPALQDFETTFATKVGDTFSVNLGLTAYTRLAVNFWSPIDVLNGRNKSSNYENSAFLYMEGVDPSQGITLDNGTGYSYAFPTAVPLPGAALLLASVLPFAWQRKRQ